MDNTIDMIYKNARNHTLQFLVTFELWKIIEFRLLLLNKLLWNVANVLFFLIIN